MGCSGQRCKREVISSVGIFYGLVEKPNRDRLWVTVVVYDSADVNKYIGNPALPVLLPMEQFCL